MPNHPFRQRVALALPLSLFAALQSTFAEEAGQTTLPKVSIRAQQATAADSPGQSISQYDEADLAIGHERSVDEVLRGEPGVSVTKGGNNGGGLLYLRGAGGQGLLTLDGLPVPDTLPGVLNLNALLPDGLQGIEVNRGFGPASQPFSSLGGAIRMISRAAVDDSADLRIEGGTFGFLKETLRGNLKGEDARLAVTVNRSDTFDGAFHAQKDNGNPERDRFHGTQALANAGVDLGENLEWEGSLLFRDSWNAIDGFGIRKGVLAPADDPENFFAEESWMAQNSLKASLSDDWLSRLQLGYTHHRNRSLFAGLNPGYTADLYLARWENDHRLWQANGDDSLHLVWGAEGRHESAFGPTFRLIAPFIFASGPTLAEERSQQAGFVETRFHYGKVNGDVGVRYESYSRFDDHALLHAGLAWQFTPQWKLRANGGNGFRIPSYGEKLFPLLGNPDIQPERSAGGDLGLEWQPTAHTKLNLTGFYSRYDDLIIVTWNPAPTAQIPCIGECLSNLPNASIAGLEAAGEIAFNDQWRGGAAYTYTDSHDLDTNRRIPFRPRDSVRLWGEWRLPTLPVTLWAEGLYRGRTYNDVDNRLDVDDALRFNAQIGYRVSPQFDVSSGAKT